MPEGRYWDTQQGRWRRKPRIRQIDEVINDGNDSRLGQGETFIRGSDDGTGVRQGSSPSRRTRSKRPHKKGGA